MVVGSSGAQPTFDVAVARYNSDGSLDATFGTGGTVVTDLGGTDRSHIGNAIALQADGKIIVAGESSALGNFAFYAVRYNADGSLDTSFDSDGIVFTPIGTRHARAYAIAIQNDGKIVVGGYARVANNDFAIVRYCADGSLDNGANCGGSGFGTGGIVATDIGGAQDQIYTLAIQDDGKILAGGYSNNTAGPNYAFTVARYNTDGTLDTTFDSDGIAQTLFSTGQDLLYDIALQPDGKIVGAGFVPFSDNNPEQNVALVRYNTNGSADTSFGTNGTVKTNINPAGADEAYGLTLDSEGKILVVGRTRIGTSGGDFDFFLMRYDVNGVLDNTFGTNGLVIEDMGTGNNAARGVLVQPDNKIVIVGSAGGFTLVRYEGTYIPLDAIDDSGVSFATDEDTAVTTGNVLDNDLGNGVKSISGFNDSGLAGTLTNNNDGTFDYDPNGQFDYLAAGEQAEDIFTYDVTDSTITDTATVTITVSGVNDAPIALDDEGVGFTTNAATAFTTGNVLSNDSDVDLSDTLSVDSVNDSSLLGTLTNNNDGTFDYDPNGMFDSLLPGQQAQDVFSYDVTDGTLTDTAVVTITVTGFTRSYETYLPIVTNNVTYAPDLVVTAMTVTANGVEVLITNQGETAVTDDFWVDVYIDPDTPPTGVNQTWETQGGEGLVWGVTNITLNPGETLLLNQSSPYYVPDLSSFSGSIATGTAVYAQVDSANVNTAFGNVLETHEILGNPYNNIMMVTAPTPVTPPRQLNQTAAALQPNWSSLPPR
ncbi:MAG: cadherin-like domain-containing protein [Ardenticatenaceae bacterium]|nr:cadherin-like domain-containing protein [Ardenticatenaceae bacterium]